MSNPYQPQNLTPRTIGKRVKRLLGLKKLRQKQLAENARLNESTVSRVINGKRMVDLLTLDRIAFGLDCALADLLDPRDPA